MLCARRTRLFGGPRFTPFLPQFALLDTLTSLLRTLRTFVLLDTFGLFTINSELAIYSACFLETKVCRAVHVRVRPWHRALALSGACVSFVNSPTRVNSVPWCGLILLSCAHVNTRTHCVLCTPSALYVL